MSLPNGSGKLSNRNRHDKAGGDIFNDAPAFACKYAFYQEGAVKLTRYKGNIMAPLLFAFMSYFNIAIRPRLSESRKAAFLNWAI